MYRFRVVILLLFAARSTVSLYQAVVQLLKDYKLASARDFISHPHGSPKTLRKEFFGKHRHPVSHPEPLRRGLVSQLLAVRIAHGVLFIDILATPKYCIYHSLLSTNKE
ncbi:uncharacterized protein LOC105700099 isoform X1 [Orussus abietinus]|uniref:uncharacterized protein LOC105700099 isoform X1 n=1 Tax=Orussus abietinus TaxID=222816 RepID=UPI000C715D2F|nr:uncharacterized protein LOC105700099 isoform X1 [Orussus abietinus]